MNFEVKHYFDLLHTVFFLRTLPETDLFRL